MNLEQFNEFAKLCTAQLDEEVSEDFFGTEAEVFAYLIKEVHTKLFSKELERQQRYQEFLKLKQEFELHTLVEEHPLIDPFTKKPYSSVAAFNPHQGTRK